MTDIKIRIENAKKTITGNESLLDMLDAEAATMLLNWGMELAGGIAQSTSGMDDASAELSMEPRLKALRQFIRATGNWAAGKYADASSRAQLKDKLLEHLKTMRGANASLPSAAELDGLLANSTGATQQQSIAKLKELLAKPG
ncbi:MAG: hypothetical protein DCC56_15170 [Anaerolineae bacterium]|nr:MAG: hypothetical protein DCC56_15170 [Anaerolineae bacterium]WKZ42447.1 MAG: hypothetical protein QY302_10115 [Anaerolineales bacterium]